VHTVNRRKGNWIGYILCRNCLLKQVIGGKVEGSVEVTGRRGRRNKQLLDDLEEKQDTGNRGRTRSYCMVNWLRKRLLVCYK
jgi:hypothetical protein